MDNFKIIYRFCDKNPNTHYKNVNKYNTISNFIDVFGDGFTIVFDNTNDIVVNNYEKCKRFNTIRTSLGNSGSFRYALSLVDSYDDNDIVYMVEDDYLHKKADLKKIICEGLSKAKWVSLYDHPDKYIDNGPNPLVVKGAELSRVYLTESTHWRTTNSTTMTFAARAKDIKKYRFKMENYLISEVPQDFQMWRSVLRDSELIIPIPGLATHCHEQWITPLSNWS